MRNGGYLLGDQGADWLWTSRNKKRLLLFASLLLLVTVFPFTVVAGSLLLSAALKRHELLVYRTHVFRKIFAVARLQTQPLFLIHLLLRTYLLAWEEGLERKTPLSRAALSSHFFSATLSRSRERSGFRTCPTRAHDLNGFGRRRQHPDSGVFLAARQEMGYDVVRFRGDVDEELICPICSGVLEEPLQVPMCEHTFCSRCIKEWINRQPTCPVDRMQITVGDLRPVPRILRNLLCRLVIACDNNRYGCTVEVKLDALSIHLAECEHNPTRPVSCKQGCGLVIPKDEIKDHNCVKELRSLIHSQAQKIGEFQQAIAEQKFQINEQKRELQLLKDFMRAMRSCNPAMKALAEQMERDDVVRWSNSLTRARILRWGGIISTPDPELQASVRLSLTESGCPPHLMDELMEHSHESKWPRGLNSLETRQLNRRHYENYVCKRIPGKQAVVALQCDNFHMGEDLMIVPGLVMIFANGSNFGRGLLEDVTD